jgi:hypothetical protein
MSGDTAAECPAVTNTIICCLYIVPIIVCVSVQYKSIQQKLNAVDLELKAHSGPSSDAEFVRLEERKRELEQLMKQLPLENRVAPSKSDDDVRSTSDGDSDDTVVMASGLDALLDAARRKQPTENPDPDWQPNQHAVRSPDQPVKAEEDGSSSESLRSRMEHPTMTFVQC